MEVFDFPQTMEIQDGAHMGEPWPMLTMAYQAQHSKKAALSTELPYQTNILVFPQTMEVHDGAHMGEPWPMLTMAYQAQHNKMQPYTQNSHIKLIFKTWKCLFSHKPCQFKREHTWVNHDQC